MKTKICPENGWLEDQLAFQTGPFPQAFHRHLWVTPGMVSWHLGKVSFCIPCILQAASWSAEFTKTHERNHHDLELEELDILFFFEDLVFFFATTAHQYLDSTQQSLFQEPPYSAAPFFQRVSCPNSDAGCTYQSSSKLQLPPGWLRGHLAIHSEVSHISMKELHELPGGARWKKVQNLLLASPGIFVFQSWKLAEAFGWLCWQWDWESSPSWVIVSPANRVPEMLSSRAEGERVGFPKLRPHDKQIVLVHSGSYPSVTGRTSRVLTSSPDEKCRHDDSQRKKYQHLR